MDAAELTDARVDLRITGAVSPRKPGTSWAMQLAEPRRVAPGNISTPARTDPRKPTPSFVIA